MTARRNAGTRSLHHRLLTVHEECEAAQSVQVAQHELRDAGRLTAILPFHENVDGQLRSARDGVKGSERGPRPDFGIGLAPGSGIAPY